MTPDAILQVSYQHVIQQLDQPHVEQAHILQRIELVSRNISNRAGVRVLLACALAKVHNEQVDIRKPYTEIGDNDVFSGRAYDEKYIAPFVTQYELPCNPTTAFLTPALRNRNTILTPDLNLSGRPKEVYKGLLDLLSDVHKERITAQQLLNETIRQLVLLRDEKKQRMTSLINSLKSARGDIPLSAEQIITLIEQHLATKGSSRLPVLVIAAIYTVLQPFINERVLPLEAHNAADSQTRAIGDVQIILETQKTSDASLKIATCYEIKTKHVTIADIDLVINEKLSRIPYAIDNYIFITTEAISTEVSDYAKTLYELIGVEFVVFDCIGFLRHFLHLFHRHRMSFLDAYQEFVLAEPDSAVNQPVKEVFLTLRQAAESE